MEQMMKIAGVALVALLMAGLAATDLHAQRGRGGGGGGGSRGGSRGGSTLPDEVIGQASRMLARDISLTREQRDSVTKLDTVYVSKERALRQEAATLARAIPAQATRANATLRTQLIALQKEYGDSVRVLLDSTQAVTFDTNRTELERRFGGGSGGGAAGDAGIRRSALQAARRQRQDAGAR